MFTQKIYILKSNLRKTDLQKGFSKPCNHLLPLQTTHQHLQLASTNKKNCATTHKNPHSPRKTCNNPQPPTITIRQSTTTHCYPENSQNNPQLPTTNKKQSTTTHYHPEKFHNNPQRCTNIIKLSITTHYYPKNLTSTHNKTLTSSNHPQRPTPSQANLIPTHNHHYKHQILLKVALLPRKISYQLTATYYDHQTINNNNPLLPRKISKSSRITYCNHRTIYNDLLPPIKFTK